MFLSIIVPVYNVEDSLRQCVKSILTQDFYDFELLLIDDGSTDSSGKIADELATIDKRICAFHKPNGGLSDARNYGLDRMKGSYVTFVDSDDELAPHTLSPLMEMAIANPDADIIEYSVLQNPGCKNERLFSPGSHNYNDCMEWLAEHGLEHCWAWNKVYNQQMFNNVRYPKGLIYEDIYTLVSLLKLKPKIMTTNSGLYLYKWNNSGIMNMSRSNGLTKLLEAQMYVVNSLNIDTHQPCWHRVYLNMFTSQLYAYRSTGQITLWPQRIALKRYGCRKDIAKALILDILGLNIACKLFKLLSRK